jgi:hypothetical protein
VKVLGFRVGKRSCGAPLGFFERIVGCRGYPTTTAFDRGSFLLLTSPYISGRAHMRQTHSGTVVRILCRIISKILQS